jgi:hypothetical protein
VFSVSGTVTGAESLLEPNGSAVATISGSNSSVPYDFGLNVAGRVSFTVGGNVSVSGETLGLTYSESSLWVSSVESDATGNGIDVSSTILTACHLLMRL